MGTITGAQASEIVRLHEDLVRDGLSIQDANRVIHNAVSRVMLSDTGLGLVPQTRRLTRTAGMPPRYVDPEEG